MQILNFLPNLGALLSSKTVVFSSNALTLSDFKESRHQSILDKIISIVSLNKCSILIDK